jgi:hypothetical protein
MDGLLTTYKKDPNFLKLVKKINVSAEIIEDIMNQINKTYPLPDGQTYDFNLREKTLRIIKNKVA